MKFKNQLTMGWIKDGYSKISNSGSPGGTRNRGYGGWNFIPSIMFNTGSKIQRAPISEKEYTKLRAVEPTKYTCPHTSIVYSLFSRYSFINTQSCECAKHYVNYFDKYQSIPYTIDPNPTRKYGNMIHRMFSRIYRAFSIIGTSLGCGILAGFIAFGIAFLIGGLASQIPYFEQFLTSPGIYEKWDYSCRAIGLGTAGITTVGVYSSTICSEVNWRLIIDQMTKEKDYNSIFNR